MECMSSVSYKILINGSPGDQIIISRGIRQGDPISPFLFLLCADGLFASLFNRERNGLTSRIKVRLEVQPLPIYFLQTTAIFSQRSICLKLMKSKSVSSSLVGLRVK